MPAFNWKKYIERYPDLVESGIDTQQKAYKHYIRFGKKENRTDHDKFALRITRIPEEELNFKVNLRVSLYSAQLPKTVDLRSKFPSCYDQGNLGSCTANSIVATYQYHAQGFMGSRLFQYYNERVLERTVSRDSGATLQNSIKAVSTSGLCSEKSWIYNIKNFTVKPPPSCYTEALKHKVLKYRNVHQNLTMMQTELNNGFPFIMGFLVYSSFISTKTNKTGIIPMPGPKDRVLGGHCIVVCGYNPTHWICRNSWGTNWGDKGYFYIPIAYLLNKKWCSDIWSITEDSD